MIGTTLLLKRNQLAGTLFYLTNYRQDIAYTYNIGENDHPIFIRTRQDHLTSKLLFGFFDGSKPHREDKTIRIEPKFLDRVKYNNQKYIPCIKLSTHFS